MYAKVYCTSFNNFVLVKFIILNLLLLLVLVGFVAGPYFIATKDTFDFLFFFNCTSLKDGCTPRGKGGLVCAFIPGLYS